jgi:geranylgeranyl pyrophosphate synthase
MNDVLRNWAGPLRARVDAWMLGRFDDAWPPRFQQACEYPLKTGGKRMRALLACAAAESVGGHVGDAVLGAAGAVELVHGYSLVHDDLPAMDDDDERRGRPTVHRAYDDATGILVGDAMLTVAFRSLARLPADAAVRIALVEELSDAAGHPGMIGGQAADVGLGGPVTELDALVRLHRGKTGALIRAAVRMGAIAGGASVDQLSALTTYGAAVGLAFQMADDVLDADEDAGADGPPSYVKLLGIAETQRRAAALRDEALVAVQGLPVPATLVALARYTIDRDH